MNESLCQPISLILRVSPFFSASYGKWLAHILCPVSQLIVSSFCFTRMVYPTTWCESNDFVWPKLCAGVRESTGMR